MSNPTDSGSSWSATPQPQPPGGWQGGPPSGPSGPRASFGQRLVAAIIDGLIVGVVFLILIIPLKTAGYFLALLIGLGYTTYFEAGPAGQTPGKRVMGIRVIRYADGGPLGWGTSFLRNICRQFISGLLCGLGYWWMLWDKEKQTWHDKIAATVVVPVDAYPPPPNSFGQPPAST
jgi:uncharacterized RDD family membrane protein YckC